MKLGCIKHLKTKQTDHLYEQIIHRNTKYLLNECIVFKQWKQFLKSNCN